MPDKPKRPKRPCIRLIKEGTIGRCPDCDSTIVRRWGFFGKIVGCIQPKCKNYYKRYLVTKPSMED